MRTALQFFFNEHKSVLLVIDLQGSCHTFAEACCISICNVGAFLLQQWLS